MKDMNFGFTMAVAIIKTGAEMLKKGREWLTEAKAPTSAGGEKITPGEIGNFFMVQFAAACDGFEISEDEYLAGIQEALFQKGYLMIPLNTLESDIKKKNLQEIVDTWKKLAAELET